MVSSVNQLLAWANSEFEQMNLNDKRLKNRLIKLAS